MNNVVLRDILSDAASVEARESFLKNTGVALVDHLKPFPDDWNFYCPVTINTSDDLHLDLTVRDEDNLIKFNLTASFDFAKRNIYLDNMAFVGIRGRGLGRALFQDFLAKTGRAGFTSLTLQSSDIGSYFWVTQNVQPDMRYGLIPKMQARLDFISSWVSAKVTDPAYSLLADMLEKPKTVRDLAAQDFRAELDTAFTSAAYKKDLQRRDTEGLHQAGDDMAEEIRIISDMIKSKQSPTLGQLLLVSSGWRGSMTIQPY